MFIRTTLSLLFVSVLASCQGVQRAEFPDLDGRLSSAAQELLQDADELEIMALHPSPHSEAGKPTDGVDDFHGYKILGRAAIGATAEQDEVIGHLYRGIIDSGGIVAACFNPRHGIRATRGKESVDFVICYECLSMQVRGPGDVTENVLTTQEPGATLTEIWARHGVKIHEGW